MPSQCTHPLIDRTAGRATLALAAVLALTLHGPARAEDRVLRVQGLFCNSEAQIDGAIAHIARGRSPRAAAKLANKDEIACTYIDRLHYQVDHPTIIGDSFGPLVKYRAMLVGVLAGDELRAVSPPVELFFVTPVRLAGAVLERRT
jgi:hypothetical protein